MRSTGCISCGRKAVYFRPYSGERYCEECYVKTIEKQIQHMISTKKLLKPDDRIVIALSGGKDSTSLLHIMSKLEEEFPKSEIVAITIDEGIAKYRSEAIKIAKENCKKLDIEHHVYSFKRLYGYTLDEIVEAAKKKEKPFICTYCGILRRKALNFAAKKVEATKLATAHNLDDEVQSMLMDFLRGDMIRISERQRGEDDLKESQGLIPRIKPLREVPERDVAFYAFLTKIQFQSFLCRYLETSLRSDVRRFLNMLENKHPGMKFAAYRSFEKIRPHIKFPENKGLGHCKICGEPTTRDICMACQILKDLDIF